MEKTYHYLPSNVCAKEMIITLDGHIVKKIETIRGCEGNTQGVNRLCEGRDIDELIALLEGIKCRGSRTKDTSCPDQLAKAFRQILEEEKL